MNQFLTSRCCVIFAVVAVCGSMLSQSWAGMARPKVMAASETDIIQLTKGNQAFACRLMHQLSTTNEGNLFFSPMSLHMALAMAYVGARGSTALEMQKMLGVNSQLEPMSAAIKAMLDTWSSAHGPAQKLQLHNGLWLEKSYRFLPEFLQINSTYFNAKVELGNFKQKADVVRQQINEHIDAVTEGKIKDFLPANSVSPDTRLLLTNAVHFQGLWDHAFDRTLTKADTFFVSQAQQVQVPFMSFDPNDVPSLRYEQLDNIELLELPYRDERLAMVVLLPKDHQAMQELLQSFADQQVVTWLQRLAEKAPQKVAVVMPRFKMNWGTHSIKAPLQALGMVQAFQAGQADFAGIDGTQLLYVQDVVHKAYIDVYEEGTEAAAATGIMLRETSVRKTPKFIANRPFVFAIIDQPTKQFLFIGRVQKPNAQ